MVDDESSFHSRENREADVAAIINNNVRNGESCVFMAIRLDVFDALDTLIQYGANVNAKVGK